MRAQEVMEELLYLNKDFQVPFETLGMIQGNRRFGAVDRPEFYSILKPFVKNHIFIAVYATTYAVALINPILKAQPMQVCYFIGDYVDVNYIYKSKLFYNMQDILLNKEYLPESNTKKIVFIDHFDNQNSYGKVFSEYTYNEWTEEDPMKLGVTNTIPKMTGPIILKNLLYNLYDDMFEDYKKRSKND